MELFTIIEVSKKLKTTKQRVYELIKAGLLQALKLGDLKVTSIELERFIKDAGGKDFSDISNIKDLAI